MVPSKRFKPIQHLAGNRERQAAASLGEALKACHAEEQRLAELQGYHAEYLERFQNARRNSLGAAQLRDYQVFLDKLETAIREQEQNLKLAHGRCEAHRHQWQDRYTHSRAMDKVVDKLEAEERKAADKREQAVQDDRSQRRPGSDS